MYGIDDLLFAYLRRLLEAIDIVSEERSIDADTLGEFGDVDLLMAKKEFLERSWDSIVILETLERDIPIQVPPMEAGEANGIFLPFLIWCIHQCKIPKQSLFQSPSIFIRCIYEPASNRMFPSFISVIKERLQPVDDGVFVSSITP